MVSIDGKKYGALGAGNDRYLITDLTGGMQVIIKQAVLPPDAPECINAELAPEPAAYTSSTDPCIGHALRVLVFYSDAAATTGLDPAATAQTGITQFNSAGINSWVNDLNGIIVGVEDYSGFDEHAGNAYGDVTAFANDSYIISERANYNADICILLTKGNYVAYGGQVLGISRKIGPEFDSACAIIEIDHANDAGTFTMAHEIGHLFGARHDRNHPNGDDNDYGHGLTFQGGNHFLNGDDYYRTIMGYPNCGTNLPNAANEDDNGNEPRIQFFSNPNNDYLGSYASGADPYDNNYLKLMNTRDRVKDFYTESLGGVHLMVHKVPFTTCDDVIEASAEITCGVATTNYFQWYLSFNGISYNAISGEVSTSISYGIDPNNPPDLYWLKCIVTNMYGTASDVAFYFRHPCMNGPRFENQTIVNNQPSILSISVAPNPADNSLNFNVETTGETIVEYEIFNLVGVKMSNLKQTILHQGNNNIVINVKPFANSSYFIKMNDGRCSYTIPFIIIH